MGLLQPALRSTAFGGGLSCGGPSIPLPRACAREPNTARPGLGGIVGWVGKRFVRLCRREALGQVGMSTRPVQAGRAVGGLMGILASPRPFSPESGPSATPLSMPT